ncbi:hypothetical protein CPB83DRAFT_909470 [Crepidotus variabilis]|uniref:Uncharacterized protein n=1 Tax=Crepidotus variabilis TaxID=179855 RepID=A0A9P6E9S3_9AGAR|nr:hypothetical protein CPB83DRAFT_909470 [Crepidotus variabilis]
MSNDLPLKIRADIRDKWDSPNAEIHSSVESLRRTLGHKVVPQVQWSRLFNGVKEQYEEKSIFVPTIFRIVASFYDRLLSRLDNESDSEWTEQLLNEFAKRPGSATWSVNVDVSGSSILRPRISWNPLVDAFLLEIPNRALPMQAEIDAGFDQDLDNLFLGASSASVNSGFNEDDWAEVTDGDTHTAEKPVVKQAAAERPSQAANIPMSQSKTTKLPSLDTLYRPAELFKAATPYTLILDASTSPLVVQGSHQPSLELIAAYLKKWAKINTQDSQKRPIFDIQLHESAFSFGLIDSLSIEPFISYRGASVNPVLVISFIEGVLGYKETHTTGHRWIFKLETILQ